MENENKTDNIYFPLCCLNFDKDISKTAGHLISYGIIEYASKLENNIELNDGDYEKIENYIEEHNLSNNEDNYFIVLSAIKLNITMGSLSKTLKQHSEIETYINLFEYKYGKDAKVKVNKGILFDVRDKKNIDERMFRVYCAVVSVIGNKSFIRITNKRISYRMLGFKSEDVYYKEKHKSKILTARQIKTVTDKLSDRNFFAMRTYRNRLTFYSTKYRDAEFDTILTNSIAMNKAKKEVKKINNEKINTVVAEKLIELRKRLIDGECYKDLKSKMELIKAG